MKKMMLAAAFTLAAFVSTGVCAQNYLGGHDYKTSEVGRLQVAKLGIVEDARRVTLHADQGWSGGYGHGGYHNTGLTTSDGCAALGAVAGGAAANRVGKGNGRIVATLFGAAIGGSIGKGACSNGPGREHQDGIEVTVKLDGGNVVVLTQALDEDFRRGDRVRIIEGGMRARITKISQ